MAAIPLKALGADERELTEFAIPQFQRGTKPPRISPPKTSPAPIPVPALDSAGRLEPKQVRQVRHVHWAVEMLFCATFWPTGHEYLAVG